MGAAFALHIAKAKDNQEHRGRTLERQAHDQTTYSHDRIDSSGVAQGASHSGRGGSQPVVVSTRGFW